MESDNVELINKDFEFFGGSILIFLFTYAFGHLMDLPEELKNKVEKLKNKGDNIKKEDLKEIDSLVNDYYNKVKKEFYENT